MFVSNREVLLEGACIAPCETRCRITAIRLAYHHVVGSETYTLYQKWTTREIEIPISMTSGSWEDVLLYCRGSVRGNRGWFVGYWTQCPCCKARELTGRSAPRVMGSCLLEKIGLGIRHSQWTPWRCVSWKWRVATDLDTDALLGPQNLYLRILSTCSTFTLPFLVR